MSTVATDDAVGPSTKAMLLHTVTRKSLSLAVVSGLFICACLTVTTCNRNIDHPSIPTGAVISGVLEGEVKLGQWHLIGPFSFAEEVWRSAPASGQDIGLIHDYLLEFGVAEGDVTEDRLLSITKQSAPPGVKLAADFQARNYDASTHPSIDFLQVFSTASYAVVYAATVIQSSTAQDVGLIVGSDDACQVWVNNTLVVSEDFKAQQGLRKYHHVLRVSLKAGRNIVLAKIDQKRPGKWAFAASVTDLPTAISAARTHSALHPLPKRFVAPGDSLQVDLNIYGERKPIGIEILNARTRSSVRKFTEDQTFFALPLDGLPTGLYYCRIQIDGNVIEEPFFYGHQDSLSRDYDRRISQLRWPGRRAGWSIEASLYRYRHLQRAVHRRADDPIWNEKVIRVVESIDQTVARSEAGLSPYGNISGRQLKGFRSEIAGQVRHYQIYVPTSAPRPLPIVLITVADQGTLRPFLESNWVALEHEIMELISAASEVGVAVAWPSARGNSSGSAIWTTDILEVLADIREDYRIDDDRIYLMGYCAGGRRALLLGARYPGLFAGIGSVGTAVRPEAGSAEEILPVVRNLRNIPIYMLHGAYDAVEPVADVRALARECQRFGFAPTVEVLEDADNQYYPGDRDARVFRFLARQRRRRSPSAVLFTTDNGRYGTANWVSIIPKGAGYGSVHAKRISEGRITITTENVGRLWINRNHAGVNQRGTVLVDVDSERVALGPSDRSWSEVPFSGSTFSKRSRYSKKMGLAGPVEDAFASGFIVVRGTSAEGMEGRRMAEAVNALQQAWRQSFFVDMPIKTDREVDDRDMLENHLILVGTPDTNRILAKMAPIVPIVVTPEAITVAGLEVRGERLTAEVVVPNPFAPNKYIVILTSNSRDIALVRDVLPAETGRFDFRIWEAGVERPIKYGVFDSSWLIPEVEIHPVGPTSDAAALLGRTGLVEVERR